MSHLLSLGFIALSLAITVAADVRTEKTALRMPRHTEKLTAPIKINVQLEGPAPQNPGDEYRLVGLITANRDLDLVDVEWRLGGKVELVIGKLKDSISLKADQETRIEITLKAKQAGAQKARLLIKGGSKEAKFTASGVFRGNQNTESSTDELELNAQGTDRLRPSESKDDEKKKRQRIFQ